MNSLDHARALLKAPAPTVADLDGAILGLDRLVADGDATLATLAAEREIVLLAGTSAEHAKLEERRGLETFNRDQASRTADLLREKLAAAREDDRRAAVAAQRERIEELMTAAGTEMATYTRHVAAIRKILGAIATADLAAELFERQNPGEAPIARAEARVRHRMPARRVTSEQRVWAWVNAEGRVFAPDQADNVQPDDHPENNNVRSGSDYGRNYIAEFADGRLRPHADYVFRQASGTGSRVWPEQVTRRAIEEDILDPPYPLAEAVKLPPLLPGDFDWGLADPASDTVLAKLEGPRQPVPCRMRVEFIADEGKRRRMDLPAAPYPQRVVPQPMPDLCPAFNRS